MVGRDGRPTRPAEWVTVPAADVLPNGFSRLEGIVRKVMLSEAGSTWAIIATTTGRSAISLSKQDGILRIGLSVNVTRPRTREVSTRAFFANRGLFPDHDYLANGVKPATTRVLDYRLPNDIQGVTTLIEDAFRVLHHLTDRSILHVRFTERPSA